MNNAQPSWKLMTQQTVYHAYDVQADHPGNLPTSTNYYQVTLEENTNSTNADGKKSSMYSLVNDGTWRCNFSGCQYFTRFQRDIKRHCSKLDHGGRREHECEFCGKAFVRKDVLKRHVTETRCWLRQAHLSLPEGDPREYQVW
ncbi:hypothetical protein JOM56_008016 [Amanita muscaria]